ncbi:zinc-binding metallopeptidase family protein [Natronorarus salvus]|uniref:M42 family peptidase n=1 Tax=Natronorarus salvus TaxID=3117733 RepID=UPI002F26CE1E
MDDDHWGFFDRLLTTPSPSRFADEVSADAYGNVVARLNGSGPEIVIAGHADQICYIVRRIDDGGFLHVGPIGGSAKTVTRGQYVEVHARDEVVPGVIGQATIHLREEHEVDEIHDVRVDIGAEDEQEARELVEVGDPLTVHQGFTTSTARLVAVGLDDRVGTWIAAEALRRASENGTEATVCGVSTVQEEVGLRGARMVGFDLHPDAAIAVDVTHATDSPDAPGNRGGDIELGGGPVVAHTSTTASTSVCDALPVQLRATHHPVFV